MGIVLDVFQKNLDEKKEQEEVKAREVEMADESEIDSGPTPIEELQTKGIAANDIKKLKEAGYGTVESVMFVPKT